MAERRMFAKSIVLSDAFLDMPLSARCLYFTFGMLADDDGFVGNPKSIIRQCGATQDDMLILLQKRFLLTFDSGIIVIKHWRINNYLQADRHKDTNYKEELRSLMLDENKAYTEIKDGVSKMYTDCIQNVSILDTQDSIGKDSIGKVILNKDKLLDKNNNQTEKQINNIYKRYGEFSNVCLTDDEFEKLKKECPLWKDYIERLSEYMVTSKKDYTYNNIPYHYKKIMKFYDGDIKAGKVKKEENRPSYDSDKWANKAITTTPKYERKSK